MSYYVNDGRFCIDNNLVKNAIRPLALGRKNFLFCGNHDVAVRAAIIYSLVDSCKALDVNPSEWMEDVLLRALGNFVTNTLRLGIVQTWFAFCSRLAVYRNCSSTSRMALSN